MSGGATAAPRSPLPPERGRAFTGQSLRYSRFVGLARLILPITAGLMILALAAWPYLSSGLDRLKAGFPRLDASQIRDLRMVNPRYTGLDKDNRPFTVSADAARELSHSDNGDDLVALEIPKSDILSKEGAWIVMTGDTGIYQPQAHFLDLFGKVTLFHDKGYQFHTSSARVDLASGAAEGHEPITGDGPSGTLAGEGFRILDKGDIIVMTGRSKLVMNGAHPGGD
jgi:lipopolysaccharide export system protein LptC